MNLTRRSFFAGLLAGPAAASLRGAVPLLPAPLPAHTAEWAALHATYVALYTDTGREVSGPGYRRARVTWNRTGPYSWASSGLIAFGTATGAWGRIVEMGLCDGDGRCYQREPLDQAFVVPVGGDVAVFLCEATMDDCTQDWRL